MVARVIRSALGGMFVGVVVLVIGLIASLGFVWATRSRAYLPGIVEAWFSEESGLPAVNFAPNPWGMLAVALLILALMAVASLRRWRRGSA